MSLSLLNAWGQTSVEYTELRTPRITFDRTTATNQTAQIQPTDRHRVPIGIEVINLVNPDQVGLVIEIQVPNEDILVQISSAQDAVANLLYLNNGLYRITPINSLEDWFILKRPEIYVTSNQTSNFTYTVSLKYFGNQSRSYTVATTIVYYESFLSSRFISTVDGIQIPKVTAFLDSVFTLPSVVSSTTKSAVINLYSNLIDEFMIAGVRRPVVCVLTTAIIQDAESIKILFGDCSLSSSFSAEIPAGRVHSTAESNLSSQFSQTGEAIKTGLSWQQTNTVNTPIPVEITFSQPGLITVYYSNNNYSEEFQISVSGTITELPAHTNGTGNDIVISIIEDTAQLYGFKIIKQTGNIYNWDSLTEVTGNTTDYSNAGNSNKNLVLTRVPTRLAPSLRYVCLANIFNFDPSCMELWDTSNLTSMNNMFKGTLVQTSQLNQMSFIEEWRTGQVTNMDQMFKYCIRFNQDLHYWCVDQIPTAPSEFDFNTTNWTKTNRLPVWGTCPTVSFNKGRYQLVALGEQVLDGASQPTGQFIIDIMTGEINDGSALLATSSILQIYGSSISTAESNIFSITTLVSDILKFVVEDATLTCTATITLNSTARSVLNAISYLNLVSSLPLNYNKLLYAESTLTGTFNATIPATKINGSLVENYPRDSLGIGGVEVDTTRSVIGGASARFGTGYDNWLRTSELDLTNTFTIEFWYKQKITNQINPSNESDIANAYPTDFAPLTFFTTRNGTTILDDSITMTFDENDDHRFLVRVQRPGITFNVVDQRISTLNPYQFHHVALVCDNTSYSLFVDGVRRGSPIQINVALDPNRLILGGTWEQFLGQTRPVNEFQGNIDEFRISNIVRYTTNFTPSTQAFVNDVNTVLLLRMDGANGSTVFTDDITDRPGV